MTAIETLQKKKVMLGTAFHEAAVRLEQIRGAMAIIDELLVELQGNGAAQPEAETPE